MGEVVCIIPARGGSKSIPRKNIKLLNGHPLIAYTIEYAKKYSQQGRVVVSTEDAEIASISKKYGAEVPFIRPKDLAGDDIQDFPVFKHCLEMFESEGCIYEYYVLLRPTSPFRAEGLIELGLAKMREDKYATSLRSVSIAKEHPYRVWQKNGDYISSFISKEIELEPYNIPRQKLPQAFFQTGDIEIIRRSTLLEGSISGNHVIPLIIDKFIDIDDESDFLVAQNMRQQ